MEPQPSELVSNVDAAWLRVDSGENPMVITTLLCFESPIAFAEVQQLVTERLAGEP